MKLLKKNEDTDFALFLPNGLPHSLCVQTLFLLSLLSCLSMLFFTFGNPILLVTFLFLGAAAFLNHTVSLAVGLIQVCIAIKYARSILNK